MEIDEFEGHYTVISCVEKVLNDEVKRTAKHPKEIRMNRMFYHYMVQEMELLPRAGYLGLPMGFHDFYIALAAGNVKIVPDRDISKGEVFVVEYYK